MKRFAAMLLVIVMTAGMSLSALAASESSTRAEKDSTSETAATIVTDDLGTSYDITAEDSDLDLVAGSAILMDANSGEVLYEKDAEAMRYPASITKVMTTLLAIENCSMDDIVTFSSEAVNGIEEGSSSAGINVGAKLTVEDTLYALMLVSANEAGAAIAEHVAGSNEAFAELMTKRAEELGCTGTHFTNPHGLPDENHYTTAHDMGLIMKQALKYSEFRKITSTLSYTLEKSDTLTDDLGLYNHAKILYENSEYYYEYAEGAKTGYTMAALNTLVTYAKKDNTELIAVVLKDSGADNSYYDTAKLFDWGFDHVKTLSPLSDFDLNTALSKNSKISEKTLNSIKNLDTSFNKDYTVVVPADSDVELSASFSLDQDEKKGELGYIHINADGKSIGKTLVTYDTESAAASSLSTDDGDDLETAPEDSSAFTPLSLLKFLIRLVIAVVLVFLIMQFVRRREAEKKRKERMKQRKNRNVKQNSTRQNRSEERGTQGSHQRRPANSSRTKASGNPRNKTGKHSRKK